MNKKNKPYHQMNTAELAQATKEYDQEFVADMGRPLTAADRKLHRQAAKYAMARGRGRPRIGRGAEKINITIERELLKDADELAKREKISRSGLIARGLSTLLRRKSA